MRLLPAIAVLTFALAATPGFAEQPKGPPDSGALIAQQKAKLAALAFLDGAWRGPATHVMPDGSRHTVTQTERIGPLLDGSIKLIEGRGYNADGSTAFNAFAVLSWDMQRQAYNFRSHAMGYAGDMKFTATADGFIWEVPAGPMTMRYTATVRDGTWHEVGDRVMPDGKQVRFFEMTLKRIGDSGWPTAGAVPMR